MKIKIAGTGSCIPKLRVTNHDLSQRMDTSDEWIKSRTGIEARHLAVEETTTSMSVEAVKNAMEQANVEAEEIELIVAATLSADHHLPCLACEIQSAIGAKNAVAFDVNAACSGFLFALNTAQMYLESGVYKKALVIGAETLSKMMDWNDRSTCVLFGDGAGAVVLEAEESEQEGQPDSEGQEKSGILAFLQGSDGSRGEVLSCKNRLNNHLYVKNDTALDYVFMNGQEVYKFAVRTVPGVIESVLEKAGLSVEDISLFVLHQANLRIIESVAKRLGQPMEKFPTNLQECGNISAASVPILLDSVNRHGMIKAGDKIVLAGFGAGLTWGATVLTW
ncbi:MAG: beta-ketoacyl-ACP synthase III [Roseburia sp.]